MNMYCAQGERVWQAEGMGRTGMGFNFSLINSAKLSYVVSLHFVSCSLQHLPDRNILYHGACIIFLKGKASDMANSL